MPGKTEMERELATQPDLWRTAAGVAEAQRSVLPRHGERVVVLGCGTSLFIAQSFAARREAARHGETDAFAASAHRRDRRYDRYMILSRSGTTTEVVELLEKLPGAATLLVTSAADCPAAQHAAHTLVLGDAAERSIVQTRFPTTALAVLRASLGEDLEKLAREAHEALKEPLPVEPGAHRQLIFLGTDWSAGIANEAALKCREVAGWWAESYLAMEFRHGPISASGPHTAVWFLGDPPPGLRAQVESHGAMTVITGRDPMTDLITVQRLAIGLAEVAGRDPDAPPGLNYSVLLDRP